MGKKSFHQRGQSLVEMALFLMILLWILGGAVDFGIGYFSYVQIRDAAQEGVIYGSIDPTPSHIEARVRYSSSHAPVDLTNTSNPVVNVWTPDGTEPGGKIHVQVVYDYSLTLPFISTIIGSNQIPLTANAWGVILKK